MTTKKTTVDSSLNWGTCSEEVLKMGADPRISLIVNYCDQIGTLKAVPQGLVRGTGYHEAKAKCKAICELYGPILAIQLPGDPTDYQLESCHVVLDGRVVYGMAIVPKDDQEPEDDEDRGF
jgi:hypothetical protein